MSRPVGSKDKIVRTKGWNPVQISILQKDYYNIKMEELSAKIGKSIRQARLKARELGLEGKRRGRKSKSVIPNNKGP